MADDTTWDGFLDPDSRAYRAAAGNRVRHLRDDDRTIRTLWEAIDAAEERVWMSMYTLGPGDVGQHTVERLAGAARRGCDVLLLYDQAGSLTLRTRHTAPLLEAAGGSVAVFNRFWPPWKKQGRLAIRNHRKITILDDVAFCGGQNLSEAFAGCQLGDWTFTDTVVRVEGPSVWDLGDVFARTWREVTGDENHQPSRGRPHPDGVTVAVLETDPRRPETNLIEVLGGAIGRARTRCYLSSPYFVPAPWLQEALVAAARNGADVRVLTAHRTDMPAARAAGRHCYGRLLRHGVRIYEMRGRILHSKTVTIDGAFGLVGSYNMDIWTSRHVLDASVAAVDAQLAAAMEEEFLDHLDEHAEEVSLDAWAQRGWLTRLKQWSALQLCRYL